MSIAKNFKNEPNKLEVEIDRLFEHLKDLNASDDDYATVADQLTKLYKLKEIDSKKRVSPDNLASIAGSIASIVMIMRFEKAGHLFTSKAVGFIGKLVR